MQDFDSRRPAPGKHQENLWPASLTSVGTAPTHQEGDSPLLLAGGCQRGAGKSELAQPHPARWEGTPFASRVTKHPARSGSRGRSSGQPGHACLPPLTCKERGWEQGAPPSPPECEKGKKPSPVDLLCSRRRLTGEPVSQ